MVFWGEDTVLCKSFSFAVQMVIVPLVSVDNKFSGWDNMELTQEQRQRLWEHHKTIALLSKNKSSAHPALVFFILVYPFAVLLLTMTWIDQISGFVEDVRAWQNFLNFLPKQPHNSCQFYSCNVDTHFPFQTTWGYNEVSTITGNNILDNTLVGGGVVVLA